MGHAILRVRRNFSANTDRWPAAVVAIDINARVTVTFTATTLLRSASVVSTIAAAGASMIQGADWM